MTTRLLSLYLLTALGLSLAMPPVCEGQEVCSACNYRVTLRGDFEHRNVPSDFPIQGAAPNNPAAFREEVYGPRFTLTVSNLPAGQYKIAIGEAETFFSGPGERLFEVTCGDTVLASNFDVFATVGGAGKVCYITGEVEHAADVVGGPLKLVFRASRNNAKFNTFALKDASGADVISLAASELADPLEAPASKVPLVTGPELWKDPSKPLDARVHDLVRRLSLAEKVRQIRNDTPAIPRLGIPAYNFWSECLHGVAADGIATVFPQAIGMAATWDVPLIHSEADVISTEARAKFNDYTARHHGNAKWFGGLTFWSPNINIFRDPRWGRGQETYGEDPFLTAQLAVAFIHGLQGDNPKYIKAMACAKHFDVHSGPEPERHRFDARPSRSDFYDTYLPQFEAAVRQGHVGGVMGSYNAVYGVPACASRFLLTDILRKRWGFDGYIVSDCGAIRNIWADHKYVATPAEAAADAVKAGCDICCGSDYSALLRAVQEKLITERQIDQAVGYALKTRFRLGLFDPPSLVPYSKITLAENDTPAHQALALKVARESIVLLKNNGLLPLDRAKIKRIAVIGPNADSVPVLLGNYNGTPSHPVTILDGIRRVAGPGIRVSYERGSPVALRRDGSNRPGTNEWNSAIAAARAADVVIYVGGINSQLEREESSRPNVFEGFHGGDRTRIELPSVQMELLKALQATGKPVVFVNCSGSAIAMPWAAAHVPAMVQAWYPGEEGGRAVAEVLFGEVNPSGRLPITFYRSTKDLPPFEDYSMANRTYRYFRGKPLFAFGHGLSYTRFKYSDARLETTNVVGDTEAKLSFNLANVGSRDGDEVSQVYFRHVHSPVPQPRLALCGFVRVHVPKGKTARITMAIPVDRFRCWDTMENDYTVPPGDYQLLIGAASDDIRCRLPFKVVGQ